MTPQIDNGLVKRDVVNIGERFVTIHELWHVTAPGCPIVAVEKRHDRGVPTAKMDDHAVFVVREFILPKLSMTDDWPRITAPAAPEAKEPAK